MSTYSLKKHIVIASALLVAVITTGFTAKAMAQDLALQLQLDRKIVEWHGLSVDRQVEAVNAWFNRHLAARSDRDIWGRQDYWALPAEFMQKGAGDCEDFALAKYHVLRALGVPEENLRLVYSRLFNTRSAIEAHLVLVYVYDDTDVRVLDNVTDSVTRLNQRRDLLPEFAFNRDTVWNVKQGRLSVSGQAKDLGYWQDYLARYALSTRRLSASISPGIDG